MSPMSMNSQFSGYNDSMICTPSTMVLSFCIATYGISMFSTDIASMNHSMTSNAPNAMLSHFTVSMKNNTAPAMIDMNIVCNIVSLLYYSYILMAATGHYLID